MGDLVLACQHEVGGGWPICGRLIGEGGTKVVGSSKGFKVALFATLFIFFPPLALVFVA
jgi:hypothetical protein